MVRGDNVTTDHISPASAIPLESQAGQWLTAHGENPKDLNQYSTRRSNHEVMMRGAFVNRAVKNQLLDQQPGEGGFATAYDGSIQRVYDTALSYVAKDVPLVIFASFNCGAGSSRDWAAKAQATLGVKAVIAQSFERIHRSNLIGMGILPIAFAAGGDAQSLQLTGNESLDFDGLETLQVGAASSVDHTPINLLQVPIGGTVAAMLELSRKESTPMPSDYSLSDVLERLFENQQALEAAIMELTLLFEEQRGAGSGRKCPWCTVDHG